jgi:hypothetical protein
MRKIICFFALLASLFNAHADEDSTLGFPNSSKIRFILQEQPWIHGLKQIPSTVIDKGVLKYVPYTSFQSGDYELNIYGDPDHPAGVEIGMYRTLLDNETAKQQCIDFLSKLLPEQAQRKALQNLSIKKDSATSGTMTVEITPPTDDDAYGGWWVSAYYVTALDYFRASPTELTNITVDKSNPQNSDWSQSDMKFARPSNPLEIALPSFTIGGVEYKQVRIVKRNPAEAAIYHSTGIATYQLEQFSPDIQRQFGYDANAAQTYRNAEAQKNAVNKTSLTPDSDPGRVYVRDYVRTNEVFVGPRGGIYHYSASGKKVYQKRHAPDTESAQ